MENSKDLLKNEKKSKGLIPEKYQDYGFMAMIIVAVFVFFAGAISGGGFGASDNVASASFATYLNEANKAGDFPQWMPSIFGGMPSFSALLATGERLYDLLSFLFFKITDLIGVFFSSDVARVASFYAIYGIGMYLLMRVKKQERFAAFFTSFAAIFSTYVITWVMIGHNTKPVVIAMFPFVFLLMEKLKDRFSVMYAALLLVVVHIMLEGGHLQMIFYGILSFGIYLLVELIISLVKKNNQTMSIVKVAATLAVVGGLSFLMSADRYFSTMEYLKYSTRGTAPLVEKGGKTANDEEKQYRYSTMWSYSPSEMINFFVPNFYGFGNQDNKLKLQVSKGNSPKKLNVYWGQKESEDSPPYMGIIVLALAIMGIIKFRKDPFVISLSAIAIIGLFLSFGKNFSLLYDIFYNIVPSFSKFRAPSMSLAMMHFTFPILAGFGLTAIMKWAKEFTPEDNKYLKGLLYGSVGFLAVGVLVSVLFETSYTDAVSKRFPEMLQNHLWKEMTSEWFLNSSMVLIVAGLAFLLAKGKIKTVVFCGAVAGLLVFDMWRVDFRPMDVSKKEIETKFFRKTDVIQYLQQDKSAFRIADFVNPANVPAYFNLQSVNGYHSAKLRVFQDLLDNADQQGTSYVTNPFIWNLFNVKYIIHYQNIGIPPIFQSKQTGAYVFRNPKMMPRASFVNRAEVAKPLDILNNIKTGSFDPHDVAFVEEALPSKIDAPDASAHAKVTEFKNEYIKIDANASGNNLMFISEVYYPVAWKAYIDGQETEIFKTNFAFRSIIVPKGKHTIELKYHSDSYATGRLLSLSFNIFAILALAAGIFFERKRKTVVEENKEEVK